VKAIVYAETGPSSVLKLQDKPLPDPGQGEVRVRVIVSGVNPTDWKFRAGMMSGYDEVTPGQDGAGVVDALGDGVTGLAVGDRVVVTMQSGTGTTNQQNGGNLFGGGGNFPGGGAGPAGGGGRGGN